MKRKIILTIVALLIGACAASLRIQEARAATVTITLYGAANKGWGFTISNITSPGPTITVNQYDNVSLTLFSEDFAPHQFFVDYNNNTIIDAGEPAMNTTFNDFATFQFIANISGNFTYRCAIHPTEMYGIFIVQPTVPEFQPILILPLFIATTAIATVICRTKHSAKKIQSTP
jgi:plastocyanin